MMNQEDYVDLHALKKEGWTNKEIAEELGYHPDTISRWLRSGPRGKVEVPDERRVMTSAWRTRIETLLGTHERLLAVSIHNKLRAEGFGGSYPTVARAVRDVRGQRFRPAVAASVPVHTDPGEEDQFDFCNLDDAGGVVGVGPSTALLRGDLVLAPGADVVVHHLGGPAPHLRRSGPNIRGLQRGARHSAHRSDGRGTSQGRRFKLHPGVSVMKAVWRRPSTVSNRESWAPG